MSSQKHKFFVLLLFLSKLFWNIKLANYSINWLINVKFTLKLNSFWQIFIEWFFTPLHLHICQQILFILPECYKMWKTVPLQFKQISWQDICLVCLYFDMFDLVQLQVCHSVLTVELMCAMAKKGDTTHILLRKQHILFQGA